MIYGIDAATTWDAPFITMTGDPSFPLFGDDRADIGDPSTAGNVAYKYYNDEKGNINEIMFNWTNADGVDASGKADVITFTIHVDENTPNGIYYINTKVKTLEGPEEEKQIFVGTDVKQPPVERDGELDGQPGEKQTDNYTVDGDQTYVNGSMEEKTFTVSSEKDPTKAYDKFRSLWIIDGNGNATLVSYDNYTTSADENGALKVTLKPEYLQSMDLGEYKFEFRFSDGSGIGTLFVVEAETTAPDEPTAPDETKGGQDATDGGSTGDSPTSPAATTKGSSSTNDTSSAANGAAVQTGSPAVAIIFVILLVMAAGIIIFNKKRRKDN